MTRMYSLLLVLFLLVACSSFEVQEARRSGLDVPPETIDLTVQAKSNEDYTDVSGSTDSVYEGLVNAHVEKGAENSPFVLDTLETSTTEDYQSTYPVMDGYKVNKNVEVFLFDDVDEFPGAPR